MVRKMLKVLYREFGGLHQAAFLLGVAALASQVLALLRDRLLAYEFGAGEALDIYYLAFRIPDLVYVSIASFVSVTVLIPFIVEKINQDKLKEVEKFLSGILSVFCLVMVLVSILLFGLMPFLVQFIAPGFSVSARSTLVELSRILLLSPFLLGLSNLLGSVTQAFNKFIAYTLSPLFYNLGIIIGIIFLLPIYGLTGIVWGVVLGALMHLMIQVPVVYQSGVVPRLTGDIRWREIGQVIKVSLPRTITLSAHQLSILALVALGTFLSAGSIAVFNFAFNLQSVPLIIIGVSYSVAAFPTLSKLLSQGQSDKFRSQVALAVRHIVFWSLPAIGLFIVLRAQIVRVILGSGEFDWVATRLTAAALALFVLSVAAQGLVNLFVRSYYAGGKTTKPLVINTFSSVLVIGLAMGLLHLFQASEFFRFFIQTLFRVEDIAGTEMLMLPLAFTLGMLVNVALLWFHFQQDFGRFSRQVTQALFHSVSTTVFAGYVAYVSLVVLADLIDISTFWGIFTQGFIAGLLGIVAGVLMLATLRSRELGEVYNSFKTRFGKVKPIVPEPEEL